MHKAGRWLPALKPGTRLAGLLALLGACLYTVRSFIYTSSLASMLDEGAYLYKGYLFVRGVYQPFQDFGPWTNKAPFAFLIPGFFQNLIGPGLRSGRWVAVAISLLTLLGLWLTARRLGSVWWAAAVVWGMALNPFTEKLYSLAISQGLVACLLVWTLALTLGEKRRTWQLLLGTCLAVVLVFTRQNMVLVLPLLILYIFWQHGSKKGWLSLGVGVAAFLLVHANYWPNILLIWLPWLPAKLTPFLDFLRLKDMGNPVQQSAITELNRLLAFLQAFRYNFLVMTGLLLMLVLWPARKAWRKTFNYRTGVFLVVLLIGLLAMHAWAALWKDYCNYCFSTYTGFFSIITPLLLIVTASSWQKQPGFLRQSAILLLVLGLFTGIGYSSFEESGYALRETFMNIMKMQLPRSRDFYKTFHFQSGTVSLEGFIENKFGLIIDPFKDIETYRRALPAAAGFLLGLLFLLVLALLYKALRKRYPIHWHFGAVAMIVFMLLGSLLASSRVLGGAAFQYDCNQGSLTSYEETGDQLAELIPPGSQVYWDVTSSATSLLLYQPNIQIHPQQINGMYAYYVGGNTQDLLRVGLWNDQAAAQWLMEADVIVVDETAMATGWKEVVSSGWQKTTIKNPVTKCNGDPVIQVYRKVP
jgi:hypothetical protein